MDKKIVGVNAGKVWQALNEVTEISIVELAEKLNLSVESTALAAGWLAKRRPDQHRTKEWNYRVAAKERLYV